MANSRPISRTRTKRAHRLKRLAERVGDIIRIPLTLGKVAIIDAVDSDLANVNWYATSGSVNKTWYAARHLIGTKSGRIHLHREIATRMGLSIDGLDVDHIDGNGLNNRRSNLRPATKSQSLINRPRPANNTSGYKGVSWNPSAKGWLASISREKKRYNLGYYSTAEEAASVYAAKAAELHGEYARRE